MSIQKIRLLNNIPYVPADYGMVKDAEFTILKRVRWLGLYTTSVIVRSLNNRTFKIERKWFEEV